MTDEQLLALAKEAREKAYAPYSDFAVGAALLCRDGSVWTGCNVENVAFSPTCCAERVAVFRAIAEGKRDFVAIAVVGGKKGTEPVACTPCGVCRQVLSEFCKDDFSVLLLDENGKPQKHTLDALLPHRFSIS